MVLVSSDGDEAAFEDHLSEQPWKALPFADRDRKAALCRQFHVQGLPALVVLDADGSTITKGGRDAVSADPTGEDFPWKPLPFSAVLRKSFVGEGGAALDRSAVDGKALGLYFSARSCPRCREFTPKLAQWYRNVRAKLPGFEIVFVSSDRDQSAFEESFAEMPWIALPYAERKRREGLSTFCGVRSIPAFAIVDQDGSIITTTGLWIPENDPEGEQFPWSPKPVKDLALEAASVNDAPSLIVLMEEADAETQNAIGAALEPVAREYQDKAKALGEAEVLFFAAGPAAEDIGAHVRALTKTSAPPRKHEHGLEECEATGNACDGCGDPITSRTFRCNDCDFDFCAKCNSEAEESPSKPITAVLLDLPDEGGYYRLSQMDPKSTESIRECLYKYKAHSLQRQQAYSLC